MPASRRTQEFTPSAATSRRAERVVPSEGEAGVAGRELQTDERHAAKGHDPRLQRGRDQRIAQGALLHHPGKRALAQVVGGKIEPSAAIAPHVHGFDGGDPVRGQPLPGADRAQEARAAGLTAYTRRS